MMGKRPPKPTVANLEFAGQAVKVDVSSEVLVQPGYGLADEWKLAVICGQAGLLHTIQVRQDLHDDARHGLLEGWVVTVGDFN